jgi:hypothetical protein
MSEHDDLTARLLAPPSPEVSCDQCFDHLDEFVELELDGADGEAAIRACARTWRAARLPRRLPEPARAAHATRLIWRRRATTSGRPAAVRER